MIDYVLAPDARQDVLEILAYIAAHNAAAADRVRERLFDAFEKLSKRPALGHRRPDLTDHRVRFWTVLGRYSVVYRGEQAPIEIMRVLGRGRDIAGLLR